MADRPGTTRRRTMISKRILFGSAVILSVAYALALPFAASAFIRLEYQGNGFYWGQGGSQDIEFAIHEAGSDDVPDLSDDAAIRLAFRAWEELPESAISFRELGGSARTETNWESDSNHLVLFDEEGSVSYFQNNAGLVAVTPVDYAGDGRITDADILFNGADHRFSTDRTSGTYDVQNIATHEVGHFIGLDHSGNFGATMYPFSEIRETRLRSLEPDDVAGAATVYPASGVYLGSILGDVRYSGGQAVPEAHVVAVDGDGIPVSATLSDEDGSYEITGLEDGVYRVYAEPLDGPVTAQNLFRREPATNFGTTWLGGNSFPASVTVTNGAMVETEPLTVRGQAGKNVTGISPPDVPIGAQGFVVYLYGSGFSSSDAVEVSGPGVEVVETSVSGSGTMLTVTLSVEDGVPAGSRNISVMNGDGDAAVLTGGITLVHKAPEIWSVSPAEGTTAGGDEVFCEASNLRDGVVVVLAGKWIEPDSVSSSSLTFTTLAADPGTYDVVLINPDGQETRLSDAFTFSGDAPSDDDPQGTGDTDDATGSSGGGSTTTSGGDDGGGGGGGGGGGCTVGGPATARGALGSLLPFVLLLGLLAGVRARRHRGEAGARPG